MKTIKMTVALLCCPFLMKAQSTWQMQPVAIQTRWASQVTPSNVLPEYPRPQMEGKYSAMTERLRILQQDGLSGSVYTQPFDVESEQNGLMTYDREVVKIPFETLRKIHQPLNPDMGMLPEVTAQNANTTDPGIIYSGMLQEYVNGRKDRSFIYNLVQTAQQNGDKIGVSMMAREYILTMSHPYKEEDFQFMMNNLNNVHDTAFNILQDSLSSSRPVIVKLMNMVYSDVIAPDLQSEQPDWNAIALKVKPYGAVGDEMYLRAQTIYLLQRQDWPAYGPVANNYMAKYGKNLSAQEKKIFTDALQRGQ
jgi:hypothetical protein